MSSHVVSAVSSKGIVSTAPGAGPGSGADASRGTTGNKLVADTLSIIVLSRMEFMSPGGACPGSGAHLESPSATEK